MSVASWTFFTASAVSVILAAWLFYKYKLATAKLNGALRELEDVKRRRAELAAQVIHQEGTITKLQKEMVRSYEAQAKSIESSVKPGTPGSIGFTIAGMREAISDAITDRPGADPVLPAAPAKPKG